MRPLIRRPLRARWPDLPEDLRYAFSVPVQLEPAEHLQTEPEPPRSPRAKLVIAVMVVALWLAIGAGVYFAGRAKGWW